MTCSFYQYKQKCIATKNVGNSFYIIIEEVHTEGIVYNVVPRIPPTKTDKNKQI